MSLVRQLVRTTTANNTQGDAIKIHDGIGYSPRQYTASDNFTTQVSWKDSSPPIIGLPIVLSAERAQQYQKWTKEQQLFKPLMGSFSIVNPSSGYALTVTDDMCKALSSHADDFTSERQQFYLGQHGSIFSKFCPGHVIAVDASNSIKLEMFLLGATNLKWKFTKGTIESVKVAGMVIECGDSCATITMSTFTAASNQIWRRINARLLDTNSGSHSKGKQEWTDSFTTAIYGNAILEDLHQKCGTNAESQIPLCRQRLSTTC